MKTPRAYLCQHCGERFSNNLRRGNHIQAKHPEQRRRLAMAKPMIPARGPRPGGSLKRDTDYYPGRP